MRVKPILTLALTLFPVVLSTSLLAQTAKPSAKSGLEAFTPEVLTYLYYNLDASEGADQANAFDISRAYIGGKYALAENFTFRYLSDIGHESGGGKLELFTKYAYLDWKLNKKVNLLFGQQATTNWKMVEKDWGYRGIRWTPMESMGDFYGGALKVYTAALDSRIQALSSGTAAERQLAARLEGQKASFLWGSRSRMGASADQGIVLSLKPDGDTYLEFMALNGSGYKKAEDDRYKNIQLRVGRYLSQKKVHLSGYFEYQPWSHTQGGVKESYANFQWDLLASYSLKDKRLLALNHNGKRFAGSYEDLTASCFSVFGNVNLAGRRDLKLLGRFDYYQTGFNNSAALAPGAAGLKTNGSLFIAGLDYMPNSHVHIIPDVQVVSYEDSAVKTSNIIYLHVLVSF